MLIKDTFATLDTTTNATKYTTPISDREANELSWHFVMSGSSLTAALTFWCSNIPNPDTADDDDWVEATDITLTGPSTASSFKGLVTVANCNAKWYRAKIVTSNGTGSATVYMHGKKVR